MHSHVSTPLIHRPHLYLVNKFKQAWCCVYWQLFSSVGKTINQSELCTRDKKWGSHLSTWLYRKQQISGLATDGYVICTNTTKYPTTLSNRNWLKWTKYWAEWIKSNIMAVQSDYQPIFQQINIYGYVIRVHRFTEYCIFFSYCLFRHWTNLWNDNISALLFSTKVKDCKQGTRKKKASFPSLLPKGVVCNPVEACWYLNSTAKQIHLSIQCSFKLMRVMHSISVVLCASCDKASVFDNLGTRTDWWSGPSHFVCFPFTEPGLCMNTGGFF